MPTRRQLALTLSFASTFLACLGSVNGLGNRPGLTSASITVAGSKFAPTSPTTINNKGNSLEEDYTIAKLDLAKTVFGPSPQDLSQHDSKPATPEQQEAYIRENKEQLLMLGMLGIQSTNNANPNSFDIRNYDGKIAMKLSRAVSLPYIPDIFSTMDPETKELTMDPETKKLMNKIYNSDEFRELEKKSLILFAEQKRLNADEILKYSNALEEVEKKISQSIEKKISQSDKVKFDAKYVKAIQEIFLTSDEVKSDTEVTEDKIKKNSAPPPKKESPDELSKKSPPDESRKLSATQLSKIKQAGRPL